MGSLSHSQPLQGLNYYEKGQAIKPLADKCTRTSVQCSHKVGEYSFMTGPLSRDRGVRVSLTQTCNIWAVMG